MGKYGKKKEIQLNPLCYNIGVIGESGIGKSTLVKELCEKLVGDDGYIMFDVGKEMGHNAISGIVSEEVPDWETFDEIVDDIVENKETYPNLKVVGIDTFDQLCEIAEKEVVRRWNSKLVKDGKPKIDTINSAYGGYGKGLDKTIELMLDKLFLLKTVGVSFIIIAHTRRTDLVDPVTQEQYSILTSNTSQKYFGAIKQKLDFLGVAYVDRDIVKIKTGKKDNRGNEIEKGKLSSESRVISFRDDTFSVDSKSRFANIVDKIPFDVNEFINAMQNAILEEQKKDGIPLSDAKKKQAKAEKEAEKIALENSEKARKIGKIDEDRNEELISIIKACYPKATDSLKASVKDIMKEYGFKSFNESDIPTKALEEIVNLLETE